MEYKKLTYRHLLYSKWLRKDTGNISKMNKYDKYKRKQWTKQDDFFAWLKIALIILTGLLFNYFIVWA